ncbi:glycosyltransferase family 4 protein [Nakamurella sp.]|uniref:glycosyltransferase family 4 protein n=1 Tax=Nakamurella sp. TaxID=1869182 RepID=UPI003B3B974A
MPTRPPSRSAAVRRPGSIVVVHSSDEMYGADRILLEVVTALRDLDGLAVEVWLPAGTGDGSLSAALAERGFPVTHLPLPILRRANLSPRGLLALGRTGAPTWRALRRRRFPAVYLMTSACLPVAPLARLAGARWVLVHLQEMWSRADRMILRPFTLFCTAAIAISPPVAEASRLRRRPPVTVVENGVSLPAAAPGAATDSGGSRGGTDGTDGTDRTDGRPRYLVASRWNAWKGHRTLLTAWDLAGCPGTLTVAGAAPPAGTGVDVPALVDELVSRPETVRIVGQVDSIGPLLDAADALILPSDQPEPFGLVLIEAFGRARPVIASRGGGPLHIVTPDVDGWLFELGSAPDLAAVLGELDRSRLRAAGTRAERTYRERYTPESYRRRLADAVRRLWS